MRFFRGVVQVCTVIGLLVLLASYLGALHPLGDSLAVFRLWIAGGVALFTVLLGALGAWRWAVLAGAAAGVALAPILWMMSVAGAEPEDVAVTIYSKNLGYAIGDHGAIADDIRAERAEVVLLQEYILRQGTLLERLSDSHPHQHLCTFGNPWHGMAVVSQWPILESYCSPTRSIAAAQIDHPDGSFWAVSVHLVWPYPEGQQEVLARALPFLDGVAGRAVVAGDFNMVPWGQSVRHIAAATGTSRIGRLFTTLEVRGVPLPIDHVFTDGLGTTERRPRLGSDHYGLVARIGWP